MVVLLGASILAAPPASASLDAPVVGVQRWTGAVGPTPVDSPFAGEETRVGTQDYQVGSASSDGSRGGWHCTVDFGDGSAEHDYWQAKPYIGIAPCQGYHAWPVGDFTVSVTVSDPAGESLTTTRDVHVVERPVSTEDGGVEGDVTTLRTPDGSSATWQLSEATISCTLPHEATSVVAASVAVRCQDDLTQQVTYDTGRQATSGAFDVTWRNGSPRPRMAVQGAGADGRWTPARRFGTGDLIWADIDTGDPSWRGPEHGDWMSERLRLGDGRVVRSHHDQDERGLSFTYDRPGVYRLRLRVSDDDGASGVVTRRIRVVRRDVSITAAGDDGETAVRVRAHLGPAGVGGRLVWTTTDGRRVVAPHLDRLEVDEPGLAHVSGDALVDGRPGYRVTADLGRGGGLPHPILVDLSDAATGRWVADEYVGKRYASVSIDAPAVR